MVLSGFEKRSARALKNDIEASATMLYRQHRTCGDFIRKLHLSLLNAEMEIESREILLPQQLLKSEIEIDLAEFDYYCNLFEKMLSRLEREEGNETYGAQPFTINSFGFFDYRVYLDEFDLDEIERMKDKFSSSRGLREYEKEN